MNIEVSNRQRKYKVDQHIIKKNAEMILSMCRANDAELSILIVNNMTIRNLNKKYRGMDKPTDVLAFPMKDSAAGSRSSHRGDGRGEGGLSKLLGDIVISMEKTHAQAAERCHSPEQEFKILLTHGILHLLGYDHEVSRSEAQRMKRKEKTILSKL